MRDGLNGVFKLMRASCKDAVFSIKSTNNCTASITCEHGTHCGTHREPFDAFLIAYEKFRLVDEHL